MAQLCKGAVGAQLARVDVSEGGENQAADVS